MIDDNDNRKPDKDLYNHALRILMEKGWVACRYLYGRGHYIDTKDKYDIRSRWKPTREQKDVVWKLVGIHRDKVDTNVIPEIFF